MLEYNIIQYNFSIICQFIIIDTIKHYGDFSNSWHKMHISIIHEDMGVLQSVYIFVHYDADQC